MSSVFRKSAMERLASPDRLDCMLKITSPFSWMGIAAAALITVLVCIWAFVGKIPDTVTVGGFFVPSYNTNTVYSTASGIVSDVKVSIGQTVKKGEAVLTVHSSKGEDMEILSDQSGIVTEILVDRDSVVMPNMEIIRISPNVGNDLVLVCYVDLDTAKQLREGMDAKVRLTAGSGGNENMQAEIMNIDRYISSGEAINEILGSDGQMANMLTMNGPVVAVSCKLKYDTDKAHSSSPKSNGREISGGEQAVVQFVLKENPPISKVFPQFSVD